MTLNRIWSDRAASRWKEVVVVDDTHWRITTNGAPGNEWAVCLLQRSWWSEHWKTELVMKQAMGIFVSTITCPSCRARIQAALTYVATKP